YLHFEQFNGEMSPLVRRLNLERGNSAAVLVFNSSTEKLILISQFRYPTYQNDHGWTIEAIAGMVDSGETPEESARRELQEEIGANIKSFEHIATFYPSPGGSSEQIYLYFAEISGEQTKYKKTGGLLASGEDIKVVELTLAEALAKIKTGEIVDAKTILGIYWLENRRLKEGSSQRRENSNE
ncbi:MAG TPA: NUDIX hydrolase, partial [Anaerolineales bacterium]|nr:NUDIX hydrolase [Anaerolineales bacterium]